MTGRILRDPDTQSIWPSRPTDLALRPEQFDLANLTLVVRRSACERFDQHAIVRWPAKGERVQHVSFGCEAYICVIELVLGKLISGDVLDLGRRSFSEDLPGTGALDSFTVDLLPLGKLFKKRKLIAVRFFLLGQRV